MATIAASVTKPIRWDATELPYGRIAYAVDKIGTFTLGWSPDTCTTTDPDQASMRLTYCERDEHHHADPATVPVIHRVRLDACDNTFAVRDAIATLADSGHSSGYWLRPMRMTTDFHREPVSDAARLRIAWIVARLVEDFLDRDHDGALSSEHLRHHAAQRVREHQHNIQRAETELAAWEQRLALEEQNLAIQQQIADGQPAPIRWPDKPTWRDYRTALTHDGQQFLLSTVGALPRR